MSEIQSHTRTRAINNFAGSFINIASMANSTGFAPLSYSNATFATASWVTNAATSNAVSSIISVPGRALFVDLGNTVVSSGRNFRKVSLIMSAPTLLPSGNPQGYAGAVGGPAGTSDGMDYLTGYIEINTFSGNSRPFPVARTG